MKLRQRVSTVTPQFGTSWPFLQRNVWRQRGKPIDRYFDAMNSKFFNYPLQPHWDADKLVYGSFPFKLHQPLPDHSSRRVNGRCWLPAVLHKLRTICVFSQSVHAYNFRRFTRVEIKTWAVIKGKKIHTLIKICILRIICMNLNFKKATEL